MKILQLVPYFPPYNGGQERYIYNLSRHLVKVGHEVHVITSNFPKCQEHEIIDGITVERHKCLARPLRNPIALGFFTLDKKIKEFDIVHTHNEHSFAAMIAAYFKRKINIPLVLTCHGQLRFGNLVSDAVERVYSRSIGQMIFKATDRIVVLSTSDKQYISSFDINADKIHIIPNAIDLDELKKFNSENQDLVSFKSKYDLHGKKIMLFVGPVIRRKGVEYLIKAIPKVLRSKGDSITFVLVGSGDFLDKAEQLIKMMNIEDHVILTGLISEQDLEKFYTSASLFVLPSLSEGLPTSIIEAMYYGLPVVATDIPGVKDHFKEVAFLIPPKNEDELAKAIVKLLNDEELAEQLSNTGVELVKSKYTWDKVVKEYENIYFRMQEDTN